MLNNCVGFHGSEALLVKLAQDFACHPSLPTEENMCPFSAPAWHSQNIVKPARYRWRIQPQPRKLFIFNRVKRIISLFGEFANSIRRAEGTPLICAPLPSFCPAARRKDRDEDLKRPYLSHFSAERR